MCSSITTLFCNQPVPGDGLPERGWYYFDDFDTEGWRGPYETEALAVAEFERHHEACYEEWRDIVAQGRQLLG